jgi:REP element-mobilizing transposase RayT
MPNHVHVVLRVLPGNKLADVVHSWKSFTAKQANELLGRRGSFWQREYYDHLIRDEQELERAMRYVSENPAKAGLRDWKWVWVCGRDARTTAGEDAGATVDGQQS